MLQHMEGTLPLPVSLLSGGKELKNKNPILFVLSNDSKYCSLFNNRVSSVQALHTAYQETCGDSQDTIAKDREEADIIGDEDCKELERLFMLIAKIVLRS